MIRTLINAGHPAVRRFGRLAGYVMLVRPFTLVAPFLSGLFGTLAPLTDISGIHIHIAIYVGVTLALAQACGQVVNQYADSELDKEVKPYRPIPSGMVSKEEALGLAWLLAIAAVARAFTISVSFGLMMLLLIFFAVFYSLPPISPRRSNPFLSLLWLAASRGFLPVLATYTMFGSVQGAIPYSIIAFTWVFGLQPTKDVADAEGDRRYGIKTVPNTYGIRGTVALMAASTAAYSALSLALWKPLMLLNLPLAVAAAITLKRQAKIVENNYAWMLFYLGLGMIYVLMFVEEQLFS